MRAALFVALLGYWTYLLLKPQPVPESVFDGFSWFEKATLMFVLAKALHFGVFAFLAAFGGTLGVGRRWVCGGLLLHATLTEVAQFYGNLYFDTHRHGCVRDVLIDAAGIAAGAWAVRRCRRRPTEG